MDTAAIREVSRKCAGALRRRLPYPFIDFQDVEQAIALALWQEQPDTFPFTAGMRRGLDEIRRETRATQGVSRIGDLGFGVQRRAALTAQYPAKSMIAHLEARIDLVRLLSGLSPRFRRIVIEHFLLDIEQKEIAKREGVDACRITQIIRLALRQLLWLAEPPFAEPQVRELLKLSPRMRSQAVRTEACTRGVHYNRVYCWLKENSRAWRGV